MKYKTRKKALVLLADGTIFYGKAVGKEGKAFGEICFNTGMTGYQEVFTDPSYFGQLMITTNAHIGNYGVNDEEMESAVPPAADEEIPQEAPAKTPLESFATNLNELAEQGKIDPLIGRKEEIQRTIQILCRRRKNNPLFVGEAGVGKTAIAESDFGNGKLILFGFRPQHRGQTYGTFQLLFNAIEK